MYGGGAAVVDGAAVDVAKEKRGVAEAEVTLAVVPMTAGAVENANGPRAG